MFSITNEKPSIEYEHGLKIIPMHPSKDKDFFVSWLKSPHAYFWNMQKMSKHEIVAFYENMQNGKTSMAFIGYFHNNPLFLLEIYDPKSEGLGELYDYQKGDIGMHFLIKPKEENITVHGLSFYVIYHVIDFIFTLFPANRIVVEPDIRNEKIHNLNVRAGFKYEKKVRLSYKEAHLAFCTKDDFSRVPKPMIGEFMFSEMTEKGDKYRNAIAHLKSDVWLRANRHLVSKILSEFNHEKIINAKKLHGSDNYPDIENYVVSLLEQNINYQFSAKEFYLDHLFIDKESIRKFENDIEKPLDAIQLIVELRDNLAISDELLPIYLDEVVATLNSLAYKFSSARPSAKELINSDFQVVEKSMDEGHPVFIANNGRIGFDSLDYLKFAPECGTLVNFVWIAVHKSKTVFSTIKSLTFEQLIEEELDQQTIINFKKVIKDHDVQLDDYYWMPVHEWQWREKISTRFASDIANNNIIFLGITSDKYQAQQSIRTFFNQSQPKKHYVKTSLSVLNMGFMRGLSPYFMSHTPQINEWVEELVSQDKFFENHGFKILREVAAIGFRDSKIEESIKKDTPYKKMLSALWRESPIEKIDPKQSLMTMASLLHVDQNNRPVVVELIKNSGLSAHDWVKAYLKVYLSPLLHCFFKYDLVFMPHGENLILILEDYKPVSIFMKDIAEEVGLLNSPVKVPEDVSRISVTIEDDMKINYIFLDIFDCFFRLLVPLLDTHTELKEKEFWGVVAENIKHYQNQFPENKAKYDYFDLFKKEFIRTCLNRLQLNNNLQMIDLEDREKNLKFAGMLANPLFQFNSI